ncbi:hypothetical protein DIPPA_32290 [Diplonema papillatum]|nr:hypothetical protein DIPPA_32290 [Diplonema papillatum]
MSLPRRRPGRLSDGSSKAGSMTVVEADDTIVSRLESLSALRERMEELATRHRLEEEDLRETMSLLLRQTSDQREKVQTLEEQIGAYEAMLSNEEREKSRAVEMVAAFKAEGGHIVTRLKASLKDATNSCEEEKEKRTRLEREVEQKLEAYRGLLEEQERVVSQLREKNARLEMKLKKAEQLVRDISTADGFNHDYRDQVDVGSNTSHFYYTASQADPAAAGGEVDRAEPAAAAAAGCEAVRADPVAASGEVDQADRAAAAQAEPAAAGGEGVRADHVAAGGEAGPAALAGAAQASSARDRRQSRKFRHGVDLSALRGSSEVNPFPDSESGTGSGPGEDGSDSGSESDDELAQEGAGAPRANGGDRRGPDPGDGGSGAGAAPPSQPSAEAPAAEGGADQREPPGGRTAAGGRAPQTAGRPRGRVGDPPARAHLGVRAVGAQLPVGGAEAMDGGFLRPGWPAPGPSQPAQGSEQASASEQRDVSGGSGTPAPR